IGAEGTLGVVTAAALRLVPAIAARTVAWAGVGSPSDALALLRWLEARTSAIEGFELVPEDSLALVLNHIHGTRPPLANKQPWNVLIEATTADSAKDISAQVERAFPGVIATGFGHLGDGNIHFHVRAATHASPDWYDREGAAITRMVDDLVTAAGGSISAEHGIGQLKLAEFARLAPP